MEAKRMLCVDEQTCRNPETIGLDGEHLESQEWLTVISDGETAREDARDAHDIEGIWVVSCNDVDSINLAATLKADQPSLKVELVDFEQDGSLLSRAHAAQIDRVVNREEFVRAYASAKAASRPRVSEALPIGREGAGGFLMPVVSGSGGAGKSAVAVLSAFISQGMGHRTLLVDYDLQFGDAHFLAGRTDPLALDDALAFPDKVERELAREEGLVLLAAPKRLEAGEGIVASIPKLIDEIAPLFDVVIANTGATWGEQHAALLERSAAVLFLIDQRSSSVRACHHALDLCSRCGIATGQFQYALNRCAKGAPLSSMDVSSALQGAHVAELKDGGRDVEDYLAAGAALDLLSTGNDLCTSLQRLLAGILPAGDATSSPAAFGQGRRRGRHSSKRKGWGR